MRVALVQARTDHSGSNRPGPLVINLDLLSFDIRGRDVLLVDDIFDTGNTLWELLPQIDELGPAQRPHGGAAAEVGPLPGAAQAGLRRLRHPQPVRGRLRHGLPRRDIATFLTWPSLEAGEMKEEPGR